VAFLDAPDGISVPPRIAHLAYLGEEPDVITLAVRSALSQSALARTLGVKQQHVSQWVNANTAPRLSDEQWATVIRLAIGALAEAA
jgi:hypothetical protein